jgi:MFS family permease
MSITRNVTAVQGTADKRKFRRIALASLVGTTIEGYDFVLYSLAAALVFPSVFFPSLGPTGGLVASMATMAVAFIARPFGAVLFGHFGDRLGRKKTLVATMMGMGLSTTLMGTVPGDAFIGVAAPILIVTLRFIQGLAAGGEWAGAVLFVTEHAPDNKRGLYAMFPQLGHTLPNAFSGASFLAVGLLMSPEAFISWGWRVPFLASALLLAVGLYIRLKIEETPVFTKEVERSGKAKVPIFEAFQKQPGTILKGAGVALTALAFVYVSNAYIVNYGVQQLGLSRNTVLAVGSLAGLVFAIFTVLSAWLSDRTGRRAMIGGAQLAGIVWAIALFPLLNMASVVTYGLAICGTMAIAGLAYGAVGAFMPEQFHTRYRYTAAGVSYQISGVIGGGLAPLVAPLLVSSYGSNALGFCLAGLSAVAAACTFSLKEKRNKTMEWSPDA